LEHFCFGFDWWVVLNKLNKRKTQLENPYKFAEKDTLKIKTKEIFI
jgi:hypothetical protein